VQSALLGAERLYWVQSALLGAERPYWVQSALLGAERPTWCRAPLLNEKPHKIAYNQFSVKMHYPVPRILRIPHKVKIRSQKPLALALVNFLASLWSKIDLKIFSQNSMRVGVVKFEAFWY